MGRRKTYDEHELIELASMKKPNGKPLTQAEIAGILNLSVPAVNMALKKLPQSVLNARDVESYRKNRADIFADAQRLILQYITPDKLKKASINQLGTLFGILYDKEQLEKGRSTSNVAVLNKSMIDEASMAKIKDVIKDMTTKQIEAARDEHGS